MADLLIWVNEQATAARAAGQASLSGTQLAESCSWYRGAVGKGIADNPRRRSQTARDGLRLAHRFGHHQDMILRFATDLAVGFTSNEAERGVRPVKAGRAPPADAGAPFRASPTSRPSRPTCPPPPNRASTPPMHSPSSSSKALATSRHPARLNSYNGTAKVMRG